VSTQPTIFLTPDEYLEIERNASYKSEYYRGEMFAMAGALESHNLILSNFIGQMYQQLRGRECRLYPSDMRLRVSDTGLYTYPDSAIVCGERRFAHDQFDTLANATVLVEVLSPSTEAYDRGFKFQLYKSIDSLQEYLLLSSEYMNVDLYTRQADGKWLLSSASQSEEVVELQSVGCRLKLADLYEKVEFASKPGARIRPAHSG
jgi:Uma2 family endonuclease